MDADDSDDNTQFMMKKTAHNRSFFGMRDIFRMPFLCVGGKERE